MFKLAVLEMPDEKITGLLAEYAEKLPQVCGSLLITDGKTPDVLGDIEPELLVISARCAKRLPTECKRIRCGVCLMPEGFLGNVEAGSAVSYGMSGRSSVTLSSIKEKECVLTLQRDVYTVSGKMIERQDIPLPRRGKISAENIMAAAASLLIMGVSPEKLV